MVEGPARRAVSCHLCNEKFFPASLPFHLKQCEKRQSTRNVNCPYCQKDLKQIDLPNHIKVCPKGGGAKKRDASRGPSGPGDHSRSAAEHGPSGPAGSANYEAEVLPDGRMRCVYCGRHFGPDRIDKHQQICGNLKNARPKGVQGEVTQNVRKIFNSTAQRTDAPGAKSFLTPQQYKKAQEEKMRCADEERQRKTGSKWRREHVSFQNACRAARGEDTLMPLQHDDSPREDGLVPCPHCNRRFEHNAADRHIPICANIVNRPKPPSSHGPASQSDRRTPSPNPSRGHGSESPPPSGGQRKMGNSSSHGGLPSLHGGGSGQPLRAGSSGQGGPAGGSGAQGARSLRQAKNSSSRLPGLGTPPSSSKDVEEGLDRTCLPGKSSDTIRFTNDGHEITSGKASVATGARIGLRRSAMLFRLLSHVPRSALERELAECGVVGTSALDDDAVIEAVFERLS